jgi:predicted metalloprotease with PDZ domain
VEYRVPGHNKVKLGVRLAQEKEGVRIKFVAEKSNAQNAGMKSGDLLLSMDGTTLAGVDDVLEILGEKNFDDRSTFQLRRKNKILKVEVVFKQPKK